MFPKLEASRGMYFGHVRCFAVRSSLTVSMYRYYHTAIIFYLFIDREANLRLILTASFLPRTGVTLRSMGSRRARRSCGKATTHRT